MSCRTLTVSMSASRASASGRRGNDKQIAAICKGFEVILFGARLGVDDDVLVITCVAGGLAFIDDLERQFPSLAPDSCATVGIPVNKECWSFLLQVGGKMYGGRGLSYPTLEAGNGDDHCPRLYYKSECLNI